MNSKFIRSDLSVIQHLWQVLDSASVNYVRECHPVEFVGFSLICHPFVGHKTILMWFRLASTASTVYSEAGPTGTRFLSGSWNITCLYLVKAKQESNELPARVFV